MESQQVKTEQGVSRGEGEKERKRAAD